MKILTKIIVIMLIIGVILTTIGFFAGGYSFKDLLNGFVDDTDFEKYNKTMDADVEKIVVNSENNIINLLVSSDEKFYFDYYQAEYYPVDISQEDNNLTLTAKDQRKMRFLNFRNPSATVRTIDIKVPVNFSGEIDLTISNGNITIDGIENIENITAITSNGKIAIKNMNIPNNVVAKTSNGTIDIINVNCDKSVDLTTSNGKITVKNTSCEKLIAKNSNGNIEVLNITSDDIDLSTSNGSINSQVNGISDEYRIDVSTNLGSINLDGIKISSQILNSSAANRLRAKTSNGSISIEFDND